MHTRTQVVHSAGAALDDVCKLYSVHPEDNPSVRAQGVGGHCSLIVPLLALTRVPPRR